MHSKSIEYWKIHTLAPNGADIGGLCVNVPMPMYERQTLAWSYIGTCRYMMGIADKLVRLYAPVLKFADSDDNAETNVILRQIY